MISQGVRVPALPMPPRGPPPPVMGMSRHRSSSRQPSAGKSTPVKSCAARESETGSCMLPNLAAGIKGWPFSAILWRFRRVRRALHRDERRDARHCSLSTSGSDPEGGSALEFSLGSCEGGAGLSCLQTLLYTLQILSYCHSSQNYTEAKMLYAPQYGNAQRPAMRPAWRAL